MVWLRLTSKALYLMKGDTALYLDKVDLEPHSTAGEFKLDVPLEWLRQMDAPSAMAIDADSSKPEPQAAPKSTPGVLDTFKRVIKTKDWGAAKAVSAAPFPLTNPKFIVIHHTASQNPPSHSSGTTLNQAKAFARSIQKDHIKSTRTRFSDSGHNFLNTVNGTILEGRHGSLDAVMKGRCVRSAHAAKDGSKLAGGNLSPGIENEGNFMTHKMDATQWDSLVELCAALCKSCNIDPSNIKGHREFSDTDCPGKWLFGQLSRLQTDVRARLT